MGIIRKLRFWIGIPVLLAFLYATTYIPHPLVHVKPGDVARIAIIDGETGTVTDIANPGDIRHITEDMNGIYFRKGKLSLSTGWKYRITLYNQKDKVIARWVVNAPNTVRFKGFFYKALNRPIDDEYLDKLVDKLPKKEP